MTLVSAKEEDGAEAEAAASSVTRTSLSIHGPRWLLALLSLARRRAPAFGAWSPAAVRRGQGPELSGSWKEVAVASVLDADNDDAWRAVRWAEI
jgi:hypothetical protein